MTQLSALKKFAEDNPDLERLEEMLAKFDAFAFLGVSGAEKIHSKILAWLLDPQENHSAGDLFLTEFLLETGAATDEQVRTVDWSNTIMQREWCNVVDGETGFLDILILNTEGKFACAIENKLFSAEHSEQLTRYRSALEQEYPAFSRSYLFLSPQGTPPKSPGEHDFWKVVDYGTILRLVEKTLEHELGPGNEDVTVFLRQYATTLRRRIVPDTEMKQMATKIYLQHKEAIDLIDRHKEAYIGDLREICKEAIGCKESWQIIGEQTEKKLLRFIDTRWDNFHTFSTGKGWQETNSLLLLDFDFRDIGQVTLILTVSSESTKADVRKMLYDKTQGQYPGIFDHRGSPRGGYHDTGTIRLYASEPILTESDIISGDRASWRNRVMEWVSEFIKNEYPEMNRIICNSFREIESELGCQKA